MIDVSLFTNIPLSEAIDIPINLNFENSPDINDLLSMNYGNGLE